MEDDDDFSDLYADVEFQASSAINAMHKLTKMPLADDGISGNATGSEKDVEGICSDLTILPLGVGDNYFTTTNGAQEIEVGSHFGVQEKSVGKLASQVCKPSENEDAIIDDVMAPCSSRGSEEDGTNFGRNDGDEKDFERGSRRTPAHDHASLDSDKYGNVQISDSEEDKLHEISDYDSDGTAEAIQTSNDTNRTTTNRRNARSRSNKVSSSVEPESSQSGHSQHDPVSSSSPTSSTALSDEDIVKSYKHSEKHPLREERHVLKPRTTNHRYSDKQRSPRLNQRSRSGTQINRRDTSDVISVKGRRDERVMFDSESNENDSRACNQSETFLSYSRGFFPNCHLNPAFLKKWDWNVYPSFGYGAGWIDVHQMDGRQNFQASQVNYEGMQDTWYGNQRRHVVQDNFKESRKLLPKYPSYAVNNGDEVQLTRRRKADDLSPLRDYTNNCRSIDSDRYDPDIPRGRGEMDSPLRGKRRRDSPVNNLDDLWRMEREDNDRRFIRKQPVRFHSHKERSAMNEGRYQRAADRDRVYLDDRCDLGIPRDKREVGSAGTGKRRLDDGPINSPDKLCCMDTEDNGRRYIKHHPLPFHSPKEPRKPCREHIRGAGGRNSGAPQRHLRYSLKDIHRESGPYGRNLSTNLITTNENINHYDRDYFVGRRHIQQPEVLHSDEELYKHREQGADIFNSEGSPNHFERILRNKRAEDRHVHDRAAKLIDEREVNRHRFELIGEEDCTNQYERSPKFFRHVSLVEMQPRYRESVDPRVINVGEKCTPQSSRRVSEEAGVDVVYNDSRYDDLMELNDSQDLKYFQDLNDSKPDKTNYFAKERNADNNNLGDKNWHDRFRDNQQNEFLEIEEGQIIELDKKLLESVVASESDGMVNPETASNGTGVVELLDDQKMQEIRAKMERRKQRFKEPVTLKRDSEKISTELNVASAEGKIGRPTRKRRW